MSETIVTQRCELCNCPLPLPLIKKCGRCMDLIDHITVLTDRSEKARAILLGVLLTPSMAAAIVDIDDAYSDGEADDYDPSREEGWRQLATIANDVYSKEEASIHE